MSSNSATSSTYLDRLVAAIELSADQAPRVDIVLKRAVWERQAIRVRYARADVVEMRFKLKSVTARADHQLAEILSNQQFSRFIEYRERLWRDFGRWRCGQ